MAVLRFVGEVSEGRLPVVFVRGNHATRGRLAELYADYFPADGKKTYFTFKLGALRGIALDCGEDKPDAHKEYNCVNVFEIYRRRQLDFLRSLSGKYDFAISHICPAQTTRTPGDSFDIEREVYGEWNKELSRLGIKFMLSGHVHEAYVLKKNDPRSILPHGYPVIVGSANDEQGGLLGAAISLSEKSAEVAFTDGRLEVTERFTLSF